MLRNFLTLSTGEAVARAIHAFAILLLVRRLLPDSFGSFELALSILSYAVLAVQQGFDTIAIREISRAPAAAGGWVWGVVRLRLAFALPVTAALALAGMVWRDTAPGVLLLVLSGSCLVNALSPKWIFLAREQPSAPASSSVLAQLLFLGVVAAFVHQPGHAARAAAGWVAGEAVATLFLWLRLKPSALAPPTPFSWPHLLKESWPVTLTLLFGLVMTNFDAVALGMLGRKSEIGLYQAAYRCTTVFWPVLAQLQASLLPRMVRWQADPARARTVALWSLLPALLAAGVLSATAPMLLGLLFGPEYAPAGRYLRLLAWVLPLHVVRLVARQVLVARGRQAADTWTSALGAATNVVADFALIPGYGAMGCAVATVLSASVVAVANWRASTRPSGESPQ